jgi:Flp pilus assembly protein TadD
MIPLVGLALAVLAGLWMPWARRRITQRADSHSSYPISAFRNTVLGVKYVGDAACARCHAEIAMSFREHPMGRSLSPVAMGHASWSGHQHQRPVFEAQGFQYWVQERGGRVFHKEARQDAHGRMIAEREHEIHYVLGAGTQALAFLIENDGFLFESPITWYALGKRWDLSPGFRTNNVHFERPIQPDCLFCHANQVEPVEGTTNRYQQPLFRGHAIGCERCHGPGELHVARPEIVSGERPAIVNPRDLEPSLREAVCEQCHLLGERRVVRAGRRSEDYRPGMPFYRFWSVFVLPAAAVQTRFVGQVEQMHQSHCFRASRGRFGCISCHDPHRVPATREKVAYYRTRCLECHAGQGCGLPRDLRLARNPNDDCAGCHMPRLASANNPHVATSDHRIPRGADSLGNRVPRAEGRSAEAMPLVHFHDDLMDPTDRQEALRDLGVAVCRAGREGAELALPLLAAALAARPDDVTGWEANGHALGQLDRSEEGLASFRTALALAPRQESALVGAASLAGRARRRQDAIIYWRRAIGINPLLSFYHAELARQYARNGDWRAAAEASRQALVLNPANLNVRKLLTQCSFRIGDAQAARAEFRALLGFEPPDRAALLRWFAQQSGTAKK